MDSIQHIMQKYWENEELIGLINCVSFSTGKIVVLEHYYTGENDDKNKPNHFLYPICDTTVESIINYQPEPWCGISGAGINNLVLENKDNIVFGEAQMGSDGFIAKLDSNQVFKWGIYLIFSNPIIEAKYVDNTIIASSDFFEFSIPLEAPEKIKVIECKRCY